MAEGAEQQYRVSSKVIPVRSTSSPKLHLKDRDRRDDGNREQSKHPEEDFMNNNADRESSAERTCKYSVPDRTRNERRTVQESDSSDLVSKKHSIQEQAHASSVPKWSDSEEQDAGPRTPRSVLEDLKPDGSDSEQHIHKRHSGDLLSEDVNREHISKDLSVKEGSPHRTGEDSCDEHYVRERRYSRDGLTDYGEQTNKKSSSANSTEEIYSQRTPGSAYRIKRHHACSTGAFQSKPLNINYRGFLQPASVERVRKDHTPKRPSNESDTDEQHVKKRKLTQLTLFDSSRQKKQMRYDDEDFDTRLSGVPRVLRAENFHCDYYEHFYSPREASELLQECEESLEYLSGDLATIKVYGRSIPIPRKQVAHGDDGLTYTYSGTTVPAKPWIPLLKWVRRKIEVATSYRFNFVLINRYKDGMDSIGEHRDDEKDLDYRHPIASLSLGQRRDFMFRHMDARGKIKKRDIDPIKMELQHGSLVMMNYPTNQYWYHSLPKRPHQPGIRINMTFRKILQKASP